MLFLLTALSKMKSVENGGSRIAIIHNGSPLFTGDAGSGPSEIRRYILEQDLLEAIIALPNDIFYNTGIATYIWVLSNKKAGTRREGKVQLINASGLYEKRRKALGNKRNDIPQSAIEEITRLYGDFAESKISRIYDTADFGYTKITVERPLRLSIHPERSLPERLFRSAADRTATEAAVAHAAETAPLDDWTAFAKATRLKASVLKKIRPYLTETDETAQPIPGEADPALRDTENVPLKEDIDGYFAREVLPFAPDAWIDRKRSVVGYEIPFTRYFYHYEAPRPAEAIRQEILALEDDLRASLKEVLGQ